MADKVGVYVCGGCGIGDVLNVDQLVNGASGAAIKKSHDHLCGAEGLALIKEDLAAGTVDGVVVAACSPRVKMGAFDFGAQVIVERANIREHVAWCRDAAADDDVRRRPAPVRTLRTICRAPIRYYLCVSLVVAIPSSVSCPRFCSLHSTE